MAGAGLPSGLTAMLAKLGLVPKMVDGKILVAKSEGKGMDGQAKGAAGEGEAQKGALLGEDGALLSGLGYNVRDHRSSAKNVAERANLERFLKEMGQEPGAPLSRGGKAPEKEAPAKKDGPPAGEQAPKAKEGEAEAPARQAREGADEARVQGHAEAREPGEAKETTEGREAEREQGHSRDQQSEEEDKPGAGWVAEELEEEEQDKARGLHGPDVLGDPHRCRGELADGGRCLRRPIRGSQYCREHFVPSS